MLISVLDYGLRPNSGLGQKFKTEVQSYTKLNLTNSVLYLPIIMHLDNQ